MAYACKHTRTRQAAAHWSADLRYCGGRSPRISVLVIRSYEWAHREETSGVVHVNQVYVRVFRLLSTFPCKALQRVSSWPVEVVCAGRRRVRTHARSSYSAAIHTHTLERGVRTRARKPVVVVDGGCLRNRVRLNPPRLTYLPVLLSR